MHVTVGVPTRDRPIALSRLLASLHGQTYEAWDLVIVSDSSGNMLDRAGELMLAAIELSGHRVSIVPGARINQTYAHNHVLWHRDTHELVLRIDDDTILSPDYLEKLVQVWTKLTEDGVSLGAVSGTIFTDHVHPRDDHPPIPTAEHNSVAVGLRGDHLWAGTFMQEYSDDDLIETEHLYSSCLYSRDAMRRVGGWPLVYSKGVSYHEETDGTYRLHLAGYKLFLAPGAKAVHSHEGAGGTRLMSPAEHKRRRESDWETFQLRLGKLRGIVNFRPSIAVCSQHCEGIGGAQRLTYTMIDALNDLLHTWFLKCVHLLPLNEEEIESPEFIWSNFGADAGVQNLDFGKSKDIYDIVISIGHKPPDLSEIPPHRHHIHYSLFPMSDGELPKGVDRFIAISEFSAQAVRDIYYRNAEVVYPFAEMAEGDISQVTKSSSILVVGRFGSRKAIEEVAAAFLEMNDLPDDTRLHIVAPEGESLSDDAWILANLVKDPRIELHFGIDQNELNELYLQSAVLWAARGYRSPDGSPEYTREHFGYTPVEALAHYCVPVAYDAGGYQETTLLRWDTIAELETITTALLNDRDFWLESLQDNLAIFDRFSREQFKNEWLRVILSTNGFAWEQSVEWRTAGTPAEGPTLDVQVLDSEIHVAVLSEDPRRPTGYGVVCQQVCAGLLDAGMKVHVLALNGTGPDLESRYASFWPSPVPLDASRYVTPKFLGHRKFDVALVMYDPFISLRLVGNARYHLGDHVPIVSFVSQEGNPAHRAWEGILAKSRTCITYCHGAAQAIQARFGKEKEIDWVHLGADHAPFHRYDDATRRALRSMLGWQDFFVIFNVSSNKRNKALWKLMQTVQLLGNEYGYDDIRLLLHSAAAPDERFHGIDVDMYAEQLGLNPRQSEDRVVWISPVPKLGTVSYESDLDELFRAGMPRTSMDQHDWFCRLGMIDRYNLADLYLDMSSVEGTGLPLLEAMACGLPAITIDDKFVRREIIGDHPALLSAYPLDVWPTGAEMMLSDPVEAASRIHAYRSGNDRIVIHNKDAERILDKLKWEEVQNKIVEAIRKCLT